MGRCRLGHVRARLCRGRTKTLLFWRNSNKGETVISTEILIAIFSSMSAVAWFVALFAFLKIHRANRESYQSAKKIAERMEAAISLQAVGMLLKKGEFFQAMEEIGMTGDWVDKLSLSEAQEIFGVRIENLRRKARGDRE
jgi:hypothetical protein